MDTELTFISIFDFEKSSRKVVVQKILIPKKTGELVYFSLQEQFKDGEEWKPTGKGINFDNSHVLILLEAVEEALPIDVYPEDCLLKTIPKNSREEIRISLKQFKGTEYFDIRTFFKDKQDVMKPSKKGITIPPDCLEDLKVGLQKFIENIKAEE